MKTSAIVFSLLFLLTSCFKKEISESVSSNSDSNRTFGDSITSTADSATVVADSSIAVVDSASAALQPLKMDYVTAKNLNTAEGWKTFLKDNPDYENKKEIEENIIRAEVNEISASKDTGAMPEAEKLSGGNQAMSAITVENDTSCDLVLRYSGTDAVKVVIPPNSKQKVSLRSGGYQVAATACGYNYAGSESLSGNYEVVYYISSVRY